MISEQGMGVWEYGRMGRHCTPTLPYSDTPTRSKDYAACASLCISWMS